MDIVWSVGVVLRPGWVRLRFLWLGAAVGQALACEHGVGIYCNSPQQFRAARLMASLPLISRYSESRNAINFFPSLCNALIKRPPMDAVDDLDLFGRI